MSQANPPATPSAELAESMESLRNEQAGGRPSSLTSGCATSGGHSRTVVEPVDPDSVELDPLTVL